MHTLTHVYILASIPAPFRSPDANLDRVLRALLMQNVRVICEHVIYLGAPARSVKQAPRDVSNMIIWLKERIPLNRPKVCVGGLEGLLYSSEGAGETSVVTECWHRFDMTRRILCACVYEYSYLFVLSVFVCVCVCRVRVGFWLWPKPHLSLTSAQSHFSPKLPASLILWDVEYHTYNIHNSVYV